MIKENTYFLKEYKQDINLERFDLKSRISKKKNLDGQKGMVVLELIPMVMLLMFMMTMFLGSFGVIHRAILNSTASRAYAWETTRQRVNVTYLRDTGSEGHLFSFDNTNTRFHTVVSHKQKGGNTGLYAGALPIRFPAELTKDSYSNSVSSHNDKVFSQNPRKRNQTVEVDQVWFMQGAGLCLNADCGP